MKTLSTILLTAVCATCASAQTYYNDNTNKDMVHHADRTGAATRVEFILPDTIAGGYIPIKADLHLHTYFSDGQVSPETRVREAWLDGLDAISITDHIEYHPWDQNMIDYLGSSLPVGTMAHNVNKNPDAKPKQDLNHSTAVAAKAAPSYGIILIPGTEITREPVGIGHYNALFTTDNNAIYDPDPLTAIRNAKAQGALVMHNHPGWRRTSIDHPDFEKKAYGEGLIDGIEVNNGYALTPGALDRAREMDLFAASTSDLHITSWEEYLGRGMRRDMTIIFAAEPTLDAIKEALADGRTVGYAAGGTLLGSQKMLSDLFHACVNVERLAGGNLKLTNPTSLRFIMRPEHGNQTVLPEMSSVIVSTGKDGTITFTVENMWTGADSHPVVSVSAPIG